MLLGRVDAYHNQNGGIMKKAKKGFVSIEYVLVAGIIVSSALFLFIAQTSVQTEPINDGINGIINIDMMP